MNTDSKGLFRRQLWRGGLLLFILLPLLPEILIVAASAYAGVVGCQIDSKMACAVGPPSASEIIRAALQIAYLIGSKFADDNIVAGWLVLCFTLIILGWARLSSRLLLAFGTSLILGILPYFGPMLAIGHLENPNCHPNEGGVPPGCKIYGGDVGDAAHDVVRLGWKFFYGAPLALVAFIIFAIVSVVIYLVAKKRVVARAHDSV
jgi:hypothetical protein